MLTSSYQKQYKAYLKKLDNGIGVKTINTSNGVENVLIITSDSVLQSSNESTINSPSPILKPLLSKFSQDNVRLEPAASFTKSSLAINRILAHLEPYLKELKPDIAGFHVFEKDNLKSAPNVQKTSVIVVANTSLAREKGVNFNIPGKLMKVHGVDKKGDIPFEADSVVKPLTIIVGDYILHINICFDLPLSCNKTTGTQTRKKLLLTSSDDDNVPSVYNIESLFFVPSQTEHKGIQTENIIPQSKGIQTEGNILSSKTAQTVSTMFTEDCTTQTESFVMSNSPEMALDIETVRVNAIIKSSHMPNVNSSNENEPDHPFISSILKKSVKNNRSNSSLSTFDSHTKFSIDTFNSHSKFNDCKSSLDTFISPDQIKNSSSSLIPESSAYESTASSIETRNDEVSRKTDEAERSKTNTTIIFDSFSGHNVNAATSGDLQKKSGTSRLDASHQSSSTKHGETFSHTEKDKIRISAGTEGKRISSSKSNMSIKEIKQHLNQTTLSLYQLYSVVEFIEDLSTKSSVENIEFIPKENTVRNIFIQNKTPKKYTATFTNETLEATNILEDKPLSDTLCDCCGLFFSKIKHHKCIGEQQTTDDKSLNNNNTDYKFFDDLQKEQSACRHICIYNESKSSGIKLSSESNNTNVCGFFNKNLNEVDMNYKFVDDSQKDHSACQHICMYNESKSSIIKLNRKSNKYDSTNAYGVNKKNMNEADVEFNGPLIFYNKNYKSLSKSSHETNLQSNLTHLRNKRQNSLCRSSLNTSGNATIKEQNACNESDLAQKAHKNKQHHKICNKNENKNRDISNNSKEELLAVIPLTKDSEEITQTEDTFGLQNKKGKETDKSKSPNNLAFVKKGFKNNTTYQKKNNSSTKVNKFLFVRHVKSMFNLRILSKAKDKSTLNADSKIENSQQSVNKISNTCLGNSQNTLVVPCFNHGNNHSSSSIIKIFNNNSQFSSKIQSSSSTLHIIPSSEECLQINREVNSVSKIDLNVCSSITSKEQKETVIKSETVENGYNNKNDLFKGDMDVSKSVSPQKPMNKDEKYRRAKVKEPAKSEKNYQKKKVTKNKKRIFCFSL